MTGSHRHASDCIVVGAGVMGCSTALHLARAGHRVSLVDRGSICREASGVNAGTLTMHMTRKDLVPYALEGWRMWKDAADWLGHDLNVETVPGVTVAFTRREAEMLEERAHARREAGAPIEVVSSAHARSLEPGLSDRVRLAAICSIDGFNSPYLLGRAFRHALEEAGVDVRECCAVDGIDRTGTGFRVRSRVHDLRSERVVLAGGVWLERMLGWLGVRIPVACLVNQLVVTERIRPVMGTVCSVASGLLSLKQFANGTVVIGGGWQGVGDRDSHHTRIAPDNFIGNVRLAAYTIPALQDARIVRAWLGFEAETADAFPLIGGVPGVPGAYVIGSVHSGYTSGPYMGRLLAQYIDSGEPERDLFDPARLLEDAVGAQGETSG